MFGVRGVSGSFGGLGGFGSFGGLGCLISCDEGAASGGLPEPFGPPNNGGLPGLDGEVGPCTVMFPGGI